MDIIYECLYTVAGEIFVFGIINCITFLFSNNFTEVLLVVVKRHTFDNAAAAKKTFLEEINEKKPLKYCLYYTVLYNSIANIHIYCLLSFNQISYLLPLNLFCDRNKIDIAIMDYCDCKKFYLKTKK